VRGAEILVLSSHNHYVVADWCTRVLWLEQGRICEDGPTDAVLEHYLGHPLRPKEEAKQTVDATS
jgi:ABC-type polysaccharide/polyol phosphate transport system ATPase subunit